MDMKKIFILWSLLLVHITISANKFYVDTAGSSTNIGYVILPWSIVHAFSTAASGDTVYIKAGNYGVVNLVVQNSNTTFLGYTNIPGDLSFVNQPDSLDTFLTNSYDQIYPTINIMNPVSGGIGVDFGSWKTGVVVKNMQILNCERGVSIVGEHHLVENMILSGFGDVNSYYHGKGMSIYGHTSTIKHCFILNGASEGISVSGDSNLVSSSKVYSNDTSTTYSLTDYYIYISPNSSTKQAKYNRIEDCYIEKRGHYLAHQGHNGHGFSITMSYVHKLCDTGGGYCYDASLKDLIATNNIIKNCTSKNIGEAIMLRGDGVRYNNLEQITSLSFGGLTIQNSARYNTFDRCNIKNSYYWKDPIYSSVYKSGGVTFLSSYYGDSTAQNCPSNENNSFPWEQQLTGNHNTFTNCLFENVASGIAMRSFADYEYPSYHSLAGQATDRINRKVVYANDFINCTFVGRADDNDALFTAERGNLQNNLTNCIIYGFKDFEFRSFTINTSLSVVSKNGIIPTDFSYTNCLFYNNGFDGSIPVNGNITPLTPAPLTNGISNYVAGSFNNCITNNDPLFTNEALFDYTLQAMSPCIDAGTNVSLMIDYAGNYRPQGNGFDLGAFEYNFTVATSEITNNDFSIYPNPSKGSIIVKIPKLYGIQPIQFYNSTGKLVKEIKVLNNETIDVSDLASGIYFVQLKNMLGNSQKFVKK